MNNIVRVLLCDDQPAVRNHLRRALAATPSIQIVGEAAGGRAGVQMALELMPDLVVMDISMPDLDGIQATKQILAAAPAIKVMIFSAECSARIVGQALSSGASGYLAKSGNPVELVLAIRTVMQGGRYVSSAINNLMLNPSLPSERTSPQRPPTGTENREPIRVVLVDATTILRERLAELLSALDGVEVVGRAADVPGAITLLRNLKPDVLVLDLDLPGQSGLDLLEEIGRSEGGPLIIMLANYDYPVLRHRCAKLGADFYFYKPIEFERVVEVCQDLAKRYRRLTDGSIETQSDDASTDSNNSR